MPRGCCCRLPRGNPDFILGVDVVPIESVYLVWFNSSGSLMTGREKWNVLEGEPGRF